MHTHLLTAAAEKPFLLVYLEEADKYPRPGVYLKYILILLKVVVTISFLQRDSVSVLSAFARVWKRRCTILVVGVVGHQGTRQQPGRGWGWVGEEMEG